MKQPTVPLRSIVSIYNPRRYFDPAKMAELAASFRAQGIAQPVVVRTVGDGTFALIAGARRCRAAREVWGEDFEMPVMFRDDLDEAGARLLALAENVIRDDMAPSEEAVAAADAVGLFKGDRDEAMRHVGWDRAKFESRLALMNCSAAVLEALDTRTIKLGHGELLAALGKDKQDVLLPVIISESKTVAELKKVIENASCALGPAIFDKSDCAACPHNSSLQTEMFGESIGTGSCTNRACFNEKTERQLETVATGLREEYPVVRIVRIGDNNTRVQLSVDGPSGVGEEQAKACHACQHYGVAVSGLPDSIGKVYRGQCFDTVCNMKKVGDRLKAEKAAQAATDPKTSSTAKGTSSPKTAGDKSGKGSGEATATSVAESERVKTYRVALWRKALRRDIGTNHDLARQYLISVVLSGYAREISDSTFKSMFERLTEQKVPPASLGKTIDLVQQTSPEVQSSLMLAMLYAAVDGVDVTHLKELCKHHKLDLGKHWKLDKALLELITKSEMMVLADELGLRAALGDEFKKIFAKSKSEVIDALLSVKDFDYAGKVPKVLKF
jgi:ParB family transcriptional regulator, chromosome partitioning protein